MADAGDGFGFGGGFDGPRSSGGPEQWLGPDPVESFGSTIDHALQRLTIELAGLRAERDGLRLELEGIRTQLQLTQQQLADRDRFASTVRELGQIVQSLSAPTRWTGDPGAHAAAQAARANPYVPPLPQAPPAYAPQPYAPPQPYAAQQPYAQPQPYAPPPLADIPQPYLPPVPPAPVAPPVPPPPPEPPAAYAPPTYVPMAPPEPPAHVAPDASPYAPPAASEPVTFAASAVPATAPAPAPAPQPAPEPVAATPSEPVAYTPPAPEPERPVYEPPAAPEPAPQPEPAPTSSGFAFAASAAPSSRMPVVTAEESFFSGPGVWIGEPPRADERRTTLKTWGTRVGTALAGLIVAMVFMVSIGPKFLPYQMFFVRSGSMHPVFDTGDMVVLTKVDASDLKKGDIITFDRPDKPGTLVTHRIVGISTNDQGRSFQTKGDANGTADPWQVPATGTGWKYKTHIPKLGFLFGYLGTPQARLALLAIPALLLGLLSIIDIWKPQPKARGRR